MSHVFFFMSTPESQASGQWRAMSLFGSFWLLVVEIEPLSPLQIRLRIGGAADTVYPSTNSR